MIPSEIFPFLCRNDIGDSVNFPTMTYSEVEENAAGRRTPEKILDLMTCQASKWSWATKADSGVVTLNLALTDMRFRSMTISLG